MATPVSPRKVPTAVDAARLRVGAENDLASKLSRDANSLNKYACVLPLPPCPRRSASSEIPACQPKLFCRDAPCVFPAPPLLTETIAAALVSSPQNGK